MLCFKQYNANIPISTALRNHNSLLGDVVLDSFNMVYRDEDSILDQICEKQIFSVFYYKD